MYIGITRVHTGTHTKAAMGIKYHIRVWVLYRRPKSHNVIETLADSLPGNLSLSLFFGKENHCSAFPGRINLLLHYYLDKTMHAGRNLLVICPERVRYYIVEL